MSDEYSAVVMRHAKEDSFRRDTEKRCEEIFTKLKPGVNWFDAETFSMLSDYFEDQNKSALIDILDAGRFRIGDFEFRRDQFGRNDKWLSCQEISSITGKSRRQMARVLKTMEIPTRREGREILYNYSIFIGFVRASGRHSVKGTGGP